MLKLVLMPTFLLRRILRKGRNHINNNKRPGMSATIGGIQFWQKPGKMPTNMCKGSVYKRLLCHPPQLLSKTGCIKAAHDGLKPVISIITTQGAVMPPVQ